VIEHRRANRGKTYRMFEKLVRKWSIIRANEISTRPRVLCPRYAKTRRR